MGKDGRKHVAQRGKVCSEHAKLVFGQVVSEPAGERGKNIETGTVGHGRLRFFSIMICVKCGGESDHQRQGWKKRMCELFLYKMVYVRYNIFNRKADR